MAGAQVMHRSPANEPGVNATSLEKKPEKPSCLADWLRLPPPPMRSTRLLVLPSVTCQVLFGFVPSVRSAGVPPSMCQMMLPT